MSESWGQIPHKLKILENVQKTIPYSILKVRSNPPWKGGKSKMAAISPKRRKLI